MPPEVGRVLVELPATPALSTTNCQAKATSAQVPQSVVEICAAADGGANTTRRLGVDQRGHRPG